MPTLDVSNLNVIISILGFFTVAYGFMSVKIKQVWYLGEALPAVVFGIALGQVSARWINPDDWVGDEENRNAITLGMCRIVIGVQLVIAGFQLPAKYQWARWRPMAILLLGTMTLMWLCTTGCMMATVPHLTFLAALVIGSCVTCTDPILSQAIAKGPFADKYVKRNLREIISSEAGANDGFGFPFLMLATYLIRHASNPDFDLSQDGEGGHLNEHSDVGRQGGGGGEAVKMWVVETLLYTILMSIAYGAVLGFMSQYGIRFALRRRWIDTESFLLWPAALGLFIVGTCGLLGTDDLLACFTAGNCMNWDGQYLEEAEERHDEVNPSIDVMLNFGGFMYIGAILPWDQFSDPDGTGLTYGRLVGLGFMILAFRRLPPIFLTYKFMPEVFDNYWDALFAGYFGPIGIGAVFYVEHTRHLFPLPGEAQTSEEDWLVRLMIPVVYWLVFFSIVVHGLSIPALNFALKLKGVKPIVDDDEGPTEMRRLSMAQSLPKNARASMDPRRASIVVNNQFTRTRPLSRSRSRAGSDTRSRLSRQASRVGSRTEAQDFQMYPSTSYPDLQRSYETEPQQGDAGDGANLTKSVSNVSGDIPWSRSITFHEPKYPARKPPGSPRPPVPPKDGQDSGDLV